MTSTMTDPSNTDLIPPPASPPSEPAANENVIKDTASEASSSAATAKTTATVSAAKPQRGVRNFLFWRSPGPRIVPDAPLDSVDNGDLERGDDVAKIEEGGIDGEEGNGSNGVDVDVDADDEKEDGLIQPTQSDDDLANGIDKSNVSSHFKTSPDTASDYGKEEDTEEKSPNEADEEHDEDDESLESLGGGESELESLPPYDEYSPNPSSNRKSFSRKQSYGSSSNGSVGSGKSGRKSGLDYFSGRPHKPTSAGKSGSAKDSSTAVAATTAANGSGNGFMSRFFRRSMNGTLTGQGVVPNKVKEDLSGNDGDADEGSNEEGVGDQGVQVDDGDGDGDELEDDSTHFHGNLRMDTAGLEDDDDAPIHADAVATPATASSSSAVSTESMDNFKHNTSDENESLAPVTPLNLNVVIHHEKENGGGVATDMSTLLAEKEMEVEPTTDHAATLSSPSSPPLALDDTSCKDEGFEITTSLDKKETPSSTPMTIHQSDEEPVPADEIGDDPTNEPIAPERSSDEESPEGASENHNGNINSNKNHGLFSRLFRKQSSIKQSSKKDEKEQEEEPEVGLEVQAKDDTASAVQETTESVDAIEVTTSISEGVSQTEVVEDLVLVNGHGEELLVDFSERAEQSVTTEEVEGGSNENEEEFYGVVEPSSPTKHATKTTDLIVIKKDDEEHTESPVEVADTEPQSESADAPSGVGESNESTSIMIPSTNNDTNEITASMPSNANTTTQTAMEPLPYDTNIMSASERAVKEEVELQLITGADRDTSTNDAAMTENAISADTNERIDVSESVGSRAANVDPEYSVTVQESSANNNEAVAIDSTEKFGFSSPAIETSLSGDETIPFVITTPQDPTPNENEVDSIVQKMYEKKEEALHKLTQRESAPSNEEVRKDVGTDKTVPNTAASTAINEPTEECHCFFCPGPLYKLLRGSKPKPALVAPSPQRQHPDASIRDMQGSIDTLRDELLVLMDQGGISLAKKDRILQEVWVIQQSLDRISSISINNLDEEDDAQNQ